GTERQKESETPFHNIDGSLSDNQMVEGTEDDIVFEAEDDGAPLDLAAEIAADDDDAPKKDEDDGEELILDEDEQEEERTTREVDKDLDNLPPKIANRIMRERRIAREAKEEAAVARSEAER